MLNDRARPTQAALITMLIREYLRSAMLLAGMIRNKCCATIASGPGNSQRITGGAGVLLLPHGGRKGALLILLLFELANHDFLLLPGLLLTIFHPLEHILKPAVLVLLKPLLGVELDQLLFLFLIGSLVLLAEEVQQPRLLVPALHIEALATFGLDGVFEVRVVVLQLRILGFWQQFFSEAVAHRIETNLTNRLNFCHVWRKIEKEQQS